MNRVVHPLRGGQGIDPPARRKGRPSPSLSLTEEEGRAVRAAIRNVARVRFGSLTKLAAALGVSPNVLTRKGRPHPGLAIALARVSDMSVDAVLGRTGLAVVASAPAANDNGGVA
jgi:hypothetical protein